MNPSMNPTMNPALAQAARTRTDPHPQPDTLAWWLFAIALSLGMLLSAQALDALGVSYEAPGGSPLAKLHPSSYVLLLAWACALVRHGNPLAVLMQSCRRRPLLSGYLGCMVVVFVWVVFRHGSSGAAYIVQTLWMPAIALFTLGLLTPRRRGQTLVLVMGLLGANALIALAEYALKLHLVHLPAELEGVQYFRASALLGHPLLNANITMALVPAVTLLPLRPALRLAFGLLLVASVLAFGARTALVVGVLVYGAHALALALLRALRGRYSYVQLTGSGALLLLGGALVAAGVWATGLGARIFSNLKWDNSANVRLAVWDAFNHLNGSDWWLGVPPLQIDHIALALGLDPRYEAIENFWIYAFLQFGAIGFVPFIIGMLCLVVLLVARAQPAMRGAVLVFFIIASTANSLSSKTISLTMLAVVVMASAAPQRERAVVRRAAAWPHAR